MFNAAYIPTYIYVDAMPSGLLFHNDVHVYIR